MKKAPEEIDKFLKHDKIPIVFTESLKFFRSITTFSASSKWASLALGFFVFVDQRFNFNGSLCLLLGVCGFAYLRKLELHCMYLVGCQCTCGNLYFEAKESNER